MMTADRVSNPSLPGARRLHQIVGNPDRDNIEAMLAFHGATRLPPAMVCDPQTAKALDRWKARVAPHQPADHIFQVLDIDYLIVDTKCRPAGYFPDAVSNTLAETLVRDFLFPNGLRTLSPREPFIICVQYSLIALEGREHLLMCPVPDRKLDRTAGVVVVGINRQMRA